jgi:hypothetical protein
MPAGSGQIATQPRGAARWVVGEVMYDLSFVSFGLKASINGFQLGFQTALLNVTA